MCPEFIIRDRDTKLGADFDRVAVGAGIRVIECPARSPLANATCEQVPRFGDWNGQRASGLW